jgi:hypothetical protein
MSIAQSLIICSSLGTDPINSAGLLLDAGVVKNAHCLAISVKIKLEENFKISVQHKVFFAINGVNSLPLPVLPSISKSSILKIVES